MPGAEARMLEPGWLRVVAWALVFGRVSDLCACAAAPVSPLLDLAWRLS
jgi:hypothetical protein